MTRYSYNNSVNLWMQFISGEWMDVCTKDVESKDEFLW